MYNESSISQSGTEKFIKNATRSPKTIDMELRFEGINQDITETYYWFFNFAYYTGKGYTTLKLEDQHYFSETSQFGTNMRQIKGGSIRAFQENLNQLIQLLKIHLFPLLKEVKQADFYYQWIEKITKYDKIVQELKGTTDPKKKEELNFARNERNEAISHLKDEWVNKTDGGRMWIMNRSSSEQGLDFALLPQLFFGTILDDPLQTKKTIKEQLDEDIYKIDITNDAKEQVARFMYRFYTWLPTAIKDTQTTFKLKIATLKQFYSQVQMYVNFMKPLLLEIQRKTQGFGQSSIYKDFEMENPDFVSLLDSSHSYVKTLGIKGLERKGYSFHDLTFTKYGLYIRKGSDIIQGNCAGKPGFISDETKDGKYEFYPSDKKDITDEEFQKLQKKTINKEDLAKFPCIQLEFNQMRRNEIVQTQQGPQQVPYMKNTILFTGYAWNFFEIATYRQSLKAENLELLESFIEELKVLKEDLLYYANYFESRDKKNTSPAQNQESKTPPKPPKPQDNTIFLGPFKGFYDIFKPLIPSIKLPQKQEKQELSDPKENKKHKIIKLNSIDDTWKLYSIYKKTHGYIQY